MAVGSVHSGVQEVRRPALIVNQVRPWPVGDLTHPEWLPAVDFDGHSHHCD